LTAARKAKGMTQEALANAAAVTRQTISSWEHGRTIPDIGSVRRLSDVLGVDFMQVNEGQTAGHAAEAVPEGEGQTADHAAEAVPEDEWQTADHAAEAVPEDEGQTTPAAAGKRPIRKWWIAAGAAVLACIAVACFLLFPHRSAPKIDTAFFTQETPNEAGKAYLTFSHRTWIENSGGSDYQMYDFTLTKRTASPFRSHASKYTGKRTAAR